MKSILVVGGAGYIGSHMCKHLSNNGYLPVVLDNLSRGHKAAVKWGPLIEGSISDRKLLKHVFSKHRVVAVMHYAAYYYLGESVTDPFIYYQNNLADPLCLLSEMVAAGVNKLVFSSTCAVYGEPEEIPITETHPQNPVNPYGRTQYMVEQVLDDFNNDYGLESVSNVIVNFYLYSDSLSEYFYLGTDSIDTISELGTGYGEWSGEISSSVPDGQYYLVAYVDPNHAVSEYDETNNMVVYDSLLFVETALIDKIAANPLWLALSISGIAVVVGDSITGIVISVKKKRKRSAPQYPKHYVAPTEQYQSEFRK